jgi:molecular chaperone GrpE
MNWKKRHQNDAGSQTPDTGGQGPGAEPGREADGAPDAWTPEAGAPGAEDAVERLRAELDAANDKYLRALADFQNFQRRARLNEEEARRQAMAGVLMSIVPVLDHFDIALEQMGKAREGGGGADGVLEGMRAIRAELVKALGSHGVSVISPVPGEPFDPHRHQAVTHQPAGGSGVEPGHVLASFQAGYALGDRVIRPAKVAVAADT